MKLFLLDLLCQLDASDNHHRRPETLQSQHRAHPLFDAPVVLFDAVVQVSVPRDFLHGATEGHQPVGVMLSSRPFADPKVSEVVVNMDRLEEEVAPHAQGVDVALAAFGVGKGSAKMPEEEVRKIEIAYPQAFCRAAKAGGARVCGVMTAAGADPEAGMKYAKIIGEKEKAVESVKFDFLGVYRPAVILGNSNTPGVLGYVMPLLHWAMPSKYHSIHKNDLARAMVAQSEQAFLAIAQGNAPKEATVKILEYKEMEPFFVKGESDEP